MNLPTTLEETGVAIVPARPPMSLSIWRMIGEMAPAMHKARLFGVSSPEAAMAIMAKGYELGLGLTAAFEFIHIIDGKPSLSPRGALALLYTSPEFAGLTLTRLTDDKDVFTGYECALKRRGGFSHTERFTLDDAKRAKLVKSGSAWELYPENMCKWRAIGFAIDVVFPDTTGGLKRADEYGAVVNDRGDVIEGSWAPSTNGSQLDPDPDPEPDELSAIIQDMTTRYGAEKVLAANDGRIPETVDQAKAIRKQLSDAYVAEINADLYGTPS